MKRVEDILVPDNERLIVDEDGVGCAVFVDVELDPIPATFTGGDVIELDVSGFQYITLDKRILRKMIKLIDQYEKI